MVHDCNAVFLSMYIIGGLTTITGSLRPRYDLRILISRINVSMTPAWNSSPATGLNESINPVINVPHLYRPQNGQVQHRGILIASYLCVRDIWLKKDICLVKDCTADDRTLKRFMNETEEINSWLYRIAQRYDFIHDILIVERIGRSLECIYIYLIISTMNDIKDIHQ